MNRTKHSKERRKTPIPNLRQVSDGISEAIREAKKVREMSFQEEVVQQLDKLNSSLEEALRQISKIMNI